MSISVTADADMIIVTADTISHIFSQAQFGTEFDHMTNKG